jgi:MFS family permease
LLITRCAVGVGEAAYGPVAPAMIADLFPLSKRGIVLAFFYMALPVGGAIGFAWGEAALALGTWHWAFFTVVPPGLALGIWAFCMRDPPKGRTDGVKAAVRKLSFADVRMLLRIPSYALNTAGMTCMAFAVGGLAYWMSDFLDQCHVAPLGPIGPRTVFGALTALAGLFSTIAGGLAGDFLRARFSGSYFLVSGIAMLIGAPAILGIVYTTFPLAWVFVFVAVFCLFFNTGPTNAILANVTHPSIRATAFALNILIIHLFGDAISPPLIGLISGAGDIAPVAIASSVGMMGSQLAPAPLLAGGTLASVGVEGHLDRGFIVVAVVTALGGVAWLCGARFLERDTRLAPTSLD